MKNKPQVNNSVQQIRKGTRICLSTTEDHLGKQGRENGPAYPEESKVEDERWRGGFRLGCARPGNALDAASSRRMSHRRYGKPVRHGYKPFLLAERKHIPPHLPFPNQHTFTESPRRRVLLLFPSLLVPSFSFSTEQSALPWPAPDSGYLTTSRRRTLPPPCAAVARVPSIVGLKVDLGIVNRHFVTPRTVRTVCTPGGRK